MLARIGFSLGVLLLSVSLTSAQAIENALLHNLMPSDATSWNRFHDMIVAPDGRWLAYSFGPYLYRQGITSPLINGVEIEDDVTAVLRYTGSSREYRYSAGHTSQVSNKVGVLGMSGSGKWVAFSFAMGANGKADQDLGQPTGQSGVAVVNTTSGARRDIGAVQNFSFVGDGRSLLLLERYPKNNKEKVFDVTLSKPTGDYVRTISGVSSYSIHPDGSSFVWVSADGIHLEDLVAQKTRLLHGGSPSAYRNITWSDSGNAVAMLFDNGTESMILVFVGLRDKMIRESVVTADGWAGFPKGYRIGEPLKWRDDEQGIFLSVSPQPARQPNVGSEETVPKLVLWHSQENRTLGERRREFEQSKREWCFASLPRKKVVQLSDSTLPVVEPQTQGRYVLGYDSRRYERVTRGGYRSSPRDYYLIDLENGDRKLVIENLRVVPRASLSIPPQLSPDGSTLIYQDNNGDYIGYDVLKNKKRNLTRELPTKFYLDENDPKTHRQVKEPLVSAFQGWSTDGSVIFISDHYDVWAVPIHGDRATNLTENGQKKDFAYVLYPLPTLPPESRRLNLHQTLYFKVFNQTTGEVGLAQRPPTQGNPDILRWDNATTTYLRASKADTFLMARDSIAESTSLFLMSENWQVNSQLTDINPQEKEFKWPPTPKYLTYQTVRGDRSQARLFLPTDYEIGNSYPTIVSIYLRMSQISTPYPFEAVVYPWLQRGYAVLLPDIQPRIDEAGQAAVEGVTAAVEAAVDTGIVDRERLGLRGHSYGGYETYFIVSQTDLFKAASPHAGMTNLWSDYGSIYADDRPKSLMYEGSQPFLSGPWWDVWDAYLTNSPLFHARNISTPLLMIHGDQDDAVSFSQALEMFNSLRRMGNKQVVLLQYVDENHQLSSGSALLDAELRRLEFFDHFLKGSSAPKWWADGVSYIEGQVPITESQKKNQ